MQPITRDKMNAVVDTGIRVSVERVCEVMLGIEVEIGETRLVGEPVDEDPGVVAQIGLAGPWSGSGTLSCKPELACKLASRMLQTEYATVNDEVLDAVAELANMVIGNLKTFVEAEVGAMGLTTPTIYGVGVKRNIGGAREWTLVPVTVCGGELLVQVCMRMNVPVEV